MRIDFYETEQNHAKDRTQLIAQNDTWAEARERRTDPSHGILL